MGSVMSSDQENTASVWDELSEHLPDVANLSNADVLDRFKTVESLTFLDYDFLEQVST